MKLSGDGNGRSGESRALILTVLLNLAAGIWWASNITTELRHTTEAVASLQATQYTKAEAHSDFRNVDLQVMDLTRRVGAIEEHKVSR